MYAYEKTILSTYHQTEAFLKSTRLAMQKGVYASFYSRKPAVDLVEEIIDLKLQFEEIEELKNAIDQALEEMKKCYAFILKVKYEIGEGKDAQVKKDAIYYRMIAYALGKFVLSMRKRGFTGEVLKEIIDKYCYLKSAYEQISNFENKVKSRGYLKHKGKSLKDKKVGENAFKRG